MNIEDIEVYGKYMIYENSFGQVTVLAKAIVNNRDLIWFETENDTGIIDAKHLVPIAIDKTEAIRKIVNDLQFALASPLGRADIEQNVIDVIDDLIDQIEEGTVVWNIGPKKE